MLRLVTSASGFSFQHTTPTDGLLKESEDAAMPGLTGSLAALSAKAAIWVTNFLALYLTVLDVSRYCQSKRSLMVGNLWSLRVNLILFSRVAGVAITTAYQV